MLCLRKACVKLPQAFLLFKNAKMLHSNLQILISEWETLEIGFTHPASKIGSTIFRLIKEIIKPKNRSGQNKNHILGKNGCEHLTGNPVLNQKFSILITTYTHDYELYPSY